MFDRIIKQALRDAGISEAAFLATLKREKFKSPIDWMVRGAPASFVDAYNERVANLRSAA